MSVVQFLPALFTSGVKHGAVGDHNVVAAVGRWVPDWFVFSHEEDSDARGEATERGRLEERAIWGRKRAYGGEGLVRCNG